MGSSGIAGQILRWFPEQRAANESNNFLLFMTEYITSVGFEAQHCKTNWFLPCV